MQVIFFYCKNQSERRESISHFNVNIYTAVWNIKFLRCNEEDRTRMKSVGLDGGRGSQKAKVQTVRIYLF